MSNTLERLLVPVGFFPNEKPEELPKPVAVVAEVACEVAGLEPNEKPALDFVGSVLVARPPTLKPPTASLFLVCSTLAWSPNENEEGVLAVWDAEELSLPPKPNGGLFSVEIPKDGFAVKSNK